MADAAFAAACLIYVLHTLDEPPTPAGEIGFGKFDFGDLQSAVALVVEKKGSFSDYKRYQLEGGFFFVLPHPPDGSRPARPVGNGLVAGSVTLSSGDCILLDISCSELAARQCCAARTARQLLLAHPAFARPHHAYARSLQAILLLLLPLLLRAVEVALLLY
jgi:hypothetical protein